MHEVTLNPGGQRFAVEEGETILDAALAAGLALPHSCRAAVCSTCRARVREGAVDHGVVFGTLSEKEKAQGIALLCRATPLSDLVIDAEPLSGFAGVAPRMLPCRVMSIERAAEDVAILRVRLPNAEGVRFVAGQYGDFLLEDGSRRSFSIAQAPGGELATQFEFHVRRVAGGSFTARVFDQLAPRDLLRLEVPLGTFAIREESDKPIIMLASGTGFAPIKAMCEAGLASGLFDRRPTTLYWGGRTRADLYAMETIAAWQHPSLHFVPVLSDATPACDWAGRTGFVHHAVMADFPDLSGHQVYACGNPLMIESARADLVARCGLPPEEFFADAFLTRADRDAAQAEA